MRIWHLIISSVGRQTICPDDSAILSGVRVLERGTSGTLALFCIVDDHIHLVVMTEDVARIAGGVLRSMRTVSTVSLNRAHREEVVTRRHMQQLVPYVLIQPTKHGLATPAPLWPGSCFLDLVGARRMLDAPPRLHQALPRIRLRDLHEAVGLPPPPIGAYTDEALRQAGAARVVAAAAAAAGVPSARTRGSEATCARRAAAVLCAAAGIPSSELAHALAVPTTSARRLMTGGADDALCAAARTRLALEEMVAAASMAPRSHSAGV